MLLSRQWTRYSPSLRLPVMVPGVMVMAFAKSTLPVSVLTLSVLNPATTGSGSLRGEGGAEYLAYDRQEESKELWEPLEII